VGGWIALSLFIGIFIGSASTMLIQCWRRRRELRYMDKVGCQSPYPATDVASMPMYQSCALVLVGRVLYIRRPTWHMHQRQSRP